MKNKIVRIVPNVDPSINNFGLEKYGEVMYNGTFHAYSVASINIVGTDQFKFITGLDDTHPSVNALPEGERTQKIKEIRQEVAEILFALDGIKVDIDDVDFWEKASKLHPTNAKFWGNIVLKIDNLGRVLNLSNMNDRLLYNVIKGGGIAEVAPSVSIAKTDFNRYKFYLDEGDALSFNIMGRKDRTKAYSLLGNLLEDTDIRSLYKMEYITKILIPAFRESQMFGEDKKDIYYNALDMYLDGKHNDAPDIAIKKFISACEKDYRVLSIAAFIRLLMNEGDVMIMQDKNFYFKQIDVTLGNDIYENAQSLLSKPLYDKFKNLVQLNINKGIRVEDLLPEQYADVVDTKEQANTNETVKENKPQGKKKNKMFLDE